MSTHEIRLSRKIPMRITHLEAYSVAVPFTAPIFSAYGVSNSR